MDITHHVFELAAALAGSFYWIKTRDYKIRPFVWYLWYIVATETLGLYGYLMLNNYDYSFFIWLKNSPFCTNIWLFNIYGFVGLILLGLFFLRHIDNKNSRQIIRIIVITCSLFALIYFLISGRFFVSYLPYDDAVRTFAIFTFVLLYLSELLNSDELLEFYKSHVFYISIGLMLWNICITPLFIFDAYHKASNSEFVVFRRSYLLISNILLYSCYTFAFLTSLYFKGKLVPKKLH